MTTEGTLTLTNRGAPPPPRSTVDPRAAYETWHREFIIVSQTWYAPSALPYSHVFEEINLLLREPDPGNTSVEFLLNWHDLSNSGRQPAARYRTAGVPRLEVFSEAWPALLACQDLLTGLSDLAQGYHCPTIAEVTFLLLRLGWSDVTQRTPPSGMPHSHKPE